MKMKNVNEREIRSSHQKCSVRKGVLRNFAKFAGKRLCQGLFFNKVAGLTKWSNTLKQFVGNFGPLPLMQCKISPYCFPFLPSLAVMELIEVEINIVASSLPTM